MHDPALKKLAKRVLIQAGLDWREYPRLRPNIKRWSKSNECDDWCYFAEISVDVVRKTFL